MTKTTTKNFGDVIRARTKSDPDLASAVEHEGFGFDVAEEVYNARQSAGLTQAVLAEKVGTSQSVIARIEDADYDGHSLKLLKRIARALDCNLRVEFYKKPKYQPCNVTVTQIDWPAQPAEWRNIEFTDVDSVMTVGAAA